MGIRTLLSEDSVKGRFQEILGRKAPGFMSSIINLVNSEQNLQKCDPRQVLGCAAVAAALDLPIDKNLGYAWIIPYKDNQKGGVYVPQFQLGYKGFIQLGMRSGQYQTMNSAPWYPGMLKEYNPITGDCEWDLDPSLRKGEPEGYVSYFRLINGYERYLLMTVDELRAHAKKYSQGYGKSWSQWSKNFPAMALKTVTKLNLSRWGVLSIEMQTAVKADQAVVTESDDGDFEFDYPDGTVIDAEFETGDATVETSGARALKDRLAAPSPDDGSAKSSKTTKDDQPGLLDEEDPLAPDPRGF